MSPIRVKCQACGTRLKANERLAGKTMSCPKCKRPLVVPEPSESIETVAAALLAKVQDTPSAPSEIISNGIRFVCPFCDEAYRVAMEMAGRSILCRNCRASSKVPVPAVPAEPAKLDEFEFMIGSMEKKLGEGLTSILSVRGMPRPLMQRFKAWCNDRGITMKDKMIDLIRECIKETKR